MTTIAEQQHALRDVLEKRGITDLRVLDAIEQTRRDLFVPEAMRESAYVDDALPIGHGQTISQPYIVALMTQELRLAGDELTLEIGTGSGYQTAILARLCARVVTIERLAPLSEAARRVLSDLGIENVDLRVGDGTRGAADQSPFDRILITAGAPSVPPPLYEQLQPGGLLVAPIGNEREQELVVVTKTPEGPQVSPLCGCRFVKLIGEEGWTAE